MKWSPKSRRQTLCTVLLTLTASVGLADQPYTARGRIQMGAGWGSASAPLFVPLPPLFGPWLPGDPFYRGYWHLPYPYVYPCYPFASCPPYWTDRLLERRRARWAGLQSQSEQQELPARIQARAGSRAEQQGAPSVGTDDAIRPEHLNSGEIRPEYRTSGEYLPEFLHGNSRPAGAH